MISRKTPSPSRHRLIVSVKLSGVDQFAEVLLDVCQIVHQVRLLQAVTCLKAVVFSLWPRLAAARQARMDDLAAATLAATAPSDHQHATPKLAAGTQLQSPSLTISNQLGTAIPSQRFKVNVVNLRQAHRTTTESALATNLAVHCRVRV